MPHNPSPPPTPTGAVLAAAPGLRNLHMIFLELPYKLMLGNQYLRASIPEKTQERNAIRSLMVKYLQDHYKAKFRIAPGYGKAPIFVLRPKSPLRITGRASIHYALTYKTKEPDHENLAFAFKPVQDTLVEMGIIKDDSPVYIETPTYEAVKIKRDDKYWFSVEIMEG